MQIITVAPIIRGALQGSLTYFSKENLDIGTVIMVPVRTREIPAIVLGTCEASHAKESLKSSEYAIRKILGAKPKHIWTPSFLKAAEHVANFSAQKLGETILALTPKTILDAHLDGQFASRSHSEHDETTAKQKRGVREPLAPLELGSRCAPSRPLTGQAIQGDTKTRLDAYQGLVRESFVKHESVFICLPSEEDVERVGRELGRGIEEYTFVFHSGITKKRMLEKWDKATAEKHAVLVVGTTQYLNLPRYFKTIVLDEEHARGWKTIMRPLLDLRIFVEKYAKENNSSFIIGAPILRAETSERVKTGSIGEFGRVSLHIRSDVKTEIIDPRIEEKTLRENTGRRELVILSNPVRELIHNAAAHREHVLLIASRKGLAPITSCGDCGVLVKCPACSTPLVIHKKESNGEVSQVFICHACGFMRAPENNVNETCPNCKGWRLQGLGIGINRIEQEVALLFPNVPVFILDGDHAKTRAQAKKIVTQFEKSAGSILIATPMAIPLLNTVEYTAIVSIDSMFAIPDIRMSERIFALILALREKTINKFFIQTRADDTTILKQALRGDLATFAENELSMRKTFAYPPYGTIIKITLRGKHADVANEMERLKTFLKENNPLVPGAMAREPARHSLSLKGSSRAMAGGPKNIFRMHMILKLDENSWPDSKLLAKLRTLPPQFTVEVNPDHLL